MGESENAPNAVWYTSAAAEEKVQIKAGAAALFSVFVVNVNTADVYLYVYDALSATGAPTLPPMRLAASGGSVSVEMNGALYLATGLYVASSSTLSTYTATTTADLIIKAHYQ